MRVILVDPATEAVTAHDLIFENDPLPAIRALIGCAQLNVIPVAGGDYAVFVDAMGMLRPGRAFWRFTDSPFKYAGRCVVTRVAPEGLPISVPEEGDPASVKEGMVFYPPEELERIEEQLAVVFNPTLERMMPMIHRQVHWRTPEDKPEEAGEVGSGWTIHENDDGSYRAIRYALQENTLRPVAMLRAPNLEAMRAALPPGLERVEPSEHEDAVEHWMVP